MCQGCAPLLSQLPTDQLGPAEQHREAWRGLVVWFLGGLVGTMFLKGNYPPGKLTWQWKILTFWISLRYPEKKILDFYPH